MEVQPRVPGGNTRRAVHAKVVYRCMVVVIAVRVAPRPGSTNFWRGLCAPRRGAGGPGGNEVESAAVFPKAVFAIPRVSETVEAALVSKGAHGIVCYGSFGGGISTGVSAGGERGKVGEQETF
ncbi:hypothetical protein V496_07776 [Pseudogymnoascus sp. VKM F-4515 (FW-2607)]|nr:hypothetical protein V496_07776 [Pseudogymnoascus sp. VKM F-4515 (FW-2607)]KFY91862.1 hypothetical protein V498_05285 [Pseudogymnoascus sp. VKM F-4517 (FW-2822)]